MTMLAGKIWSRLSLNINNRKLGALWGTHCKIRSCRFCTEVAFVQFASTDDQWVHCIKLHCVNCITLVHCVYCTELHCSICITLDECVYCIKLQCVYCISATCLQLRSPVPSFRGAPLPPPPPYCWIHIALFLFTSIRNNGPFLFKVPVRRQRLAILIQHCSSVVSQAFQGWRKIIFHFERKVTSSDWYVRKSDQVTL